jgi:hypothetical protein
MRHSNRLFISKVFVFKAFYYLLFFFVVFRLWSNLSYNGPFNDEAIYVVLGKLGIFQHDWTSYGSMFWVSGWEYIYPVLTALAFQTYGIVGSRFLNTVFGLITLEVLVFWILKISKTYSKQVYIVSSLLILTFGFSGSFFYVTRLATMDMLSFMLFISSCTMLVYGLNANRVSGTPFFIAGICLIGSILTKYSMSILAPFSIVVSLWSPVLRNTNIRRIWLFYFALPVGILLGLFITVNINALVIFYQNEVEVIHSSRYEVLQELWLTVRWIVPLWLLGSIGMIIKKQWKWFILFSFLALLFPVYHIAMSRVQTFNKHIFMTVAAVSCIASLGISNVLLFPLCHTYKKIVNSAVVIFCCIYAIVSLSGTQSERMWWFDTRNVMTFFNQKVKSGDRVLAESGASIILANYPHNHPLYVTTFDWFTYYDKEGIEAYTAAVADGYFTYIQLEHTNLFKNDDIADKSNEIAKSINEHYTSVYDQDGAIVYKRTFNYEKQTAQP